MPTWTVNHGAAVWLGWNESVTFNCGDNGTKLAFQLLSNQRSVADVLTAVHATGCRPPDLTAHPADKSSCRLAAWRANPNEPAVPDQRDFKLLRLVSNGASLYADISFYAVPNFDEIFFYVDTGGTNAAEVLVKCHLNNFEVYKQSTPGLYNIKVYTGTPVKSGMKYSLAIPWNTAFGSVPVVKVWLYDMTGKDRLPDAGSVVVVK